MRDIAPSIYRQRAIVEGRCLIPIDDGQIERYLNSLATVLDMHIVMPAITHRSEHFGWAGWVHWETSGAHFYAWESPFPFFSVDVYTCKQFSLEKLVKFTAEFFDAKEIAFKSV